MKPFRNPRTPVWIGRILIGLVIFSNLQCAVYFLVHPEYFAPAYELSGIPGEAAIRGFAILFCMWNIPYLFAVAHPIRHRTSLIESNLMQFTGLLGESWLVTQIPLQYAVLRNSIFRFIIFDGAGLLLLFLALVMTRGLTRPTVKNE